MKVRCKYEIWQLSVGQQRLHGATLRKHRVIKHVILSSLNFSTFLVNIHHALSL
jgi:hypothetical protein